MVPRNSRSTRPQDLRAQRQASSDGGREVESRGARPWVGWLSLMALVALPVTSLVTFAIWPPGQTADPESSLTPDPGMSHVHGLGSNPSDGTIYVATHSGVFRLAAGAEPERVAQRYQDTMGFTVAGPDTFLASGHPDPAEQGFPLPLGLIESTDAADTWQEKSLGGTADLHALDVGPGGVVIAFDAISGQTMISVDKESWQVVADEAVLDIAANPTRPKAFMSTTPRGELIYFDEFGTRVARPSAPPMERVDWPTADLLIGAAADGSLYRSRDSGYSWERVGRPLGVPQAIDVSESGWIVATEDELLRSVDEGQTWTTLAELGA